MTTAVASPHPNGVWVRGLPNGLVWCGLDPCLHPMALTTTVARTGVYQCTHACRRPERVFAVRLEEAVGVALMQAVPTAIREYAQVMELPVCVAVAIRAAPHLLTRITVGHRPNQIRLTWRHHGDPA